MNTPVQQIKDRLDIVEFIRSYVPLMPAGKNFKAPCPFHKEKTPSFIVSPERQTWHCFGSCNEGGDIFKFLMKHDNLEFYEALQILAEKAGIELKKISPAEHRQFGVLYEINEGAKNFFKNFLSQSKSALEYLKDRGLKKETIEQFELGLAPESFDDLTLHLLRSGFEVKDIERAGLNFKTENGGYVDRFRGRLMFPICDSNGKVVAFSGRVGPRLQKENPDLAKYINSPETPIFSKSRILYGFHASKPEIRQARKAVLVEGQMDFLMAYQDGVKNAVATSGTALTPDHISILKRVADELIMSFDNDEAGLKAAESAIDLAGSADLGVKLLILDEYKDPAEAVQKSPGYLLEAVANTKPAMEFYFDRHLGTEAPDSVVELKKNLRAVLGKIKKLSSAVERGHWIRLLSERAKMDEKSLFEEMSALKPEATRIMEKNQNFPSGEKRILSRMELIAERLVGLAVAKEEFASALKECEKFLPSNYFAVFKKIFATENGIGEPDAELEEIFNAVTLRSTFESSLIEEDKIKEEFDDLLRQLKKEHLKGRREELIVLIKDAETKGEEKKVESALKEFDEVVKMMNN
jgi:DNA primase